MASADVVGFDSRPVNVGFVVVSVALDTILHEFLSFLLIIPLYLFI